MSRIKLIVTGASGFIGGHVTESSLRNSEFEVLALSRMKRHNTVKVSSYSDAPEGDVLVHLAEDNNPESVRQGGIAYEANVLDSLSALLKKKFGRVIYASSAILYGDQSSTPHAPTDKVFIDTPYARVKRLAENAVLANPRGIVVRLANVYGPNMSRGNVLSEILEQIQVPGDLEVRDSKPVRDFIWVQDVAEGILSLALMNLPKNESNRVYNLGSGVGTSIGGLARMALDISGQTERRVASKIHSDIHSSIVLDNRETTHASGWVPKTALFDGVASLVNSNQKNYS